MDDEVVVVDDDDDWYFMRLKINKAQQGVIR